MFSYSNSQCDNAILIGAFGEHLNVQIGLGQSFTTSGNMLFN